jgi:hypothetical protein
MNVFSIDGYMVDKDGNAEYGFDDFLVTVHDEVPERRSDEEFFFHGISEEEIKEAIRTGEPVAGDFVITAYRPEEEISYDDLM